MLNLYRDGRLRKGDELLMINGQTLLGMTHQEAVDVLRKSEPLVQIVVASKVRGKKNNLKLWLLFIIINV